MKNVLRVFTFVLPVSFGKIIGSDFVNLDFESPDLTHLSSGRTLTSEALRGWNFTSDEGPDRFRFSYVGFVTATPLTLTAGLDYPRSTAEFGTYGLFFGNDETKPPANYTLSQNGSIPQGAVSLKIFDYDAILGIPSSSSFQCQVNGQRGEIRKLSGFGALEVDVSKWAGQEVNLSFKFGSDQTHLFDISGFVSTPEPNLLLLSCVGVTLVFLCRHRVSRRWR